MNNAYYKVMYGIFFIVLLGGGILRFILRLNFTDPETGFLTVHGALPIAFYIILGAGLAAMIALNQLRPPDRDFQVPSRGIALSIMIILSAAALAVYMWIGLPDPLEPPTPLATPEMVLIVRWVNIGLGYLSAIAFLVSGIAGLARRTPPGILMVVPPVWQIILLISRFNGYHAVLHIADYTLVILFMMFTAMFLMGHARSVCGLGRKDGRNYVISSGLSAAVCGLLLSLPSYALTIGGRPPDPMFSAYERLYVITMSLYALAYVFSYTKSMRQV